MDFRTIEVLIWLVKDPHLKRTAQRLNVSQPTLTKRLAQLEESVGCKLFTRRGSQGLEPSPLALELADSAKILLDSWSNTMNLTRMKGSNRPFLSIDGPSIFMQTVIAPLWPQSELASNFLIHLRASTTADINFDITNQDLDAAFIFDKNKAMDFKFMPVCKETMAVVYNKKCEVEPSVLLSKADDGMRWISHRPDRDPLTLLAQSDLLPQKNYTGFFEDIPTLLNVIASDPRYAAVLPYHAVMHNTAKLRGLPIPGSSQTIYFVYRGPGERNAKLRGFGEFVTNSLKGNPYFTTK